MAELEIIGPARHPGVIVCRMACFEKGTLHLHCVPRPHNVPTASSRWRVIRSCGTAR
jgi:hypothetical protein